MFDPLQMLFTILVINGSGVAENVSHVYFLALLLNAYNMYGGKLLQASQIDVLAKLPTLDQARSMLMTVMLAPVTKLARTMNEVPSKVTRAVAAVRDQKQEAA